jgi:hypothetical protein
VIRILSEKIEEFGKSGLTRGGSLVASTSRRGNKEIPADRVSEKLTGSFKKTYENRLTKRSERLKCTPRRGPGNEAKCFEFEFGKISKIKLEAEIKNARFHGPQRNGQRSRKASGGREFEFEKISKIKLEAERKNGRLLVPLKTAEVSQRSERFGKTEP